MTAQTRLQGLSPVEKRELLAKLLAKEAARTRSFQLSFSQQRLWLLDRIDPGTPAYNISRHLRIFGELDVAALERALSEIVRRHEVLRTRFGPIDDEPAQIVGRANSLPLDVVDLRNLPRDEGEAALRELAQGEAGRRFDLTHDLMVRTKLVILDAQEHALLLAFHHIAVDGWSIEIFMDELEALYEAYHAGREPALEELALQYADFATWQRERAESPADLAYWQAHLAGAPPVVKLPADRPRPAVPTFAGASASAAFPRALADQIAALARSAGVTPFMVLLAAFDALLVRYGCGEDIVVGTPIAGRSRPELEPLIGFFVNTLALRVDCSGDPPFAELLARTKDVTLAAFERRDVPFERVVEAVRPQRVPGANALVQVLFALQTASHERTAFAGLRIERIRVENTTAKFDLTVSISELREGLEVQCEYSTALFDEATIRRLLADYERLVAACVAVPQSRLSAFPLAPLPAAPAAPAPQLNAAPRTHSRGDEAPPDAKILVPLRALWTSILGKDEILPDDDFFELGGHSLGAARLLAECARQFCRRVSFGEFYARPTLRALAHSLGEPPDALPQPAQEGLLWKLQTAGERVPFFFLHGDTAAGAPYCREIARGLGADQPFYAFAPHGSDSGPVPPTIEAMAADFLARIEALQPNGPYRLGGFCQGGIVAFEMARQLAARNITVERLVIVNAPAPERRYTALGPAFRAVAPILRVSPRRRQVLQLLLVSRIVRIQAALRRGPRAALEQIGDALKSVARPRAWQLAAGGDVAGAALDDRAFEALLAAQRGYVARPYAGAISLLWAEGEPQLYDADPTVGWQRYARTVDVVSIPGDHMSSVVEHGELVGTLIGKALSEGAAAPPSLARSL